MTGRAVKRLAEAKDNTAYLEFLRSRFPAGGAKRFLGESGGKPPRRGKAGRNKPSGKGLGCPRIDERPPKGAKTGVEGRKALYGPANDFPESAMEALKTLVGDIERRLIRLESKIEGEEG